MEQSIRPEGPFFATYRQTSEWRDLDRGALRIEVQSRGLETSNWWDSSEWQPGATTVVAEGVPAAWFGKNASRASESQLQSAAETLALSPERVLLTALAAPDLRAQPDATLHGVIHHLVAFTWQSHPVRLFLTTYTMLPAAVEITRDRPFDLFWHPWGDVTSRTTFENWTLEPNGIRYPRQFDVVSMGLPDRSFIVTELHFNPAIPADAFAVTDQVRQAKPRPAVEDLPFGAPGAPVVDLAPGLVQIAGSWNVGEALQDDGIVVIEGPISSGYSAQAIADAEKRFTGKRVQAVVTTSDSWPHIGGLREYAARGIAIHALDLNRAIIERLLAAPHRETPDRLARNPRGATLEIVRQRTLLGTGPNRMELIPYRTVTGERQMMIYFPERQILYSSDLFSRGRDGSFFLPGMVLECVEAARREKLRVRTVFGMHLAPTPWSDLEEATKRPGAER